MGRSKVAVVTKGVNPVVLSSSARGIFSTVPYYWSLEFSLWSHHLRFSYQNLVCVNFSFFFQRHVFLLWFYGRFKCSCCMKQKISNRELKAKSNSWSVKLALDHLLWREYYEFSLKINWKIKSYLAHSWSKQEE